MLPSQTMHTFKRFIQIKFQGTTLSHASFVRTSKFLTTTLLVLLLIKNLKYQDLGSPVPWHSEN